jgi:hypothetical protein
MGELLWLKANWLAGVDGALAPQEKLEARKMLENGGDSSPPSALSRCPFGVLCWLAFKDTKY